MDYLLKKWASKEYMQNVVISVATNVIILMVGLISAFLLKILFF